jgi:hypothetical protein
MLALLGLNKLWTYLLLALAVSALIVALVATVFMQGRKSAQVDAVVRSMKSLQASHKERAKVEAMRSSEARQRLKDRWSSR